MTIRDNLENILDDLVLREDASVDDSADKIIKLFDGAVDHEAELLTALRSLKKAIQDAHLLDVKKHFSLCVADAAAGTAIAKAEGRRP